MHSDISRKVSRVLNVILLGMLLIFIRVWYLAIIQHDMHVEKSKRPQRQLVLEKVERGTIRDRFGEPLATNHIQYNVGVCYADIRAIPSVRWEKEKGKKPKKIYARLEYIQKLAKLLGDEVGVSPETIEDTIHGKAALFPHTPFIIKEGISEEKYYKLKMLEKDWRGICTQRGSIRSYPKGRTGCDVVGYLGSISHKEYHGIAQELHELEAYLQEREEGKIPILPKGFNNPLEVRERFQQLKEKSYTIHDLVGKTGIESTCDEQLRGYVGKRFESVDTKGNTLSELPGGKQAIAGQRVTLSISSELQEFAEQLLARNEEIRAGPCSLEQPWIKGGAIIALDPATGEVLALASYPRFDPNDFIPTGDEKERQHKQKNVRRWLESETYIGEIWDGRRPLERERFSQRTGKFYDQSLNLELGEFLSAIAPSTSPVLSALDRLKTIGNVYAFQKHLEQLLALSEQPHMSVLIDTLYPHDILSRHDTSLEERQQVRSKGIPQGSLDEILRYIPHNDDKLLLIDLCRLFVSLDLFNDQIISHVGNQSLAAYQQATQKVVSLQKLLLAPIKSLFHERDFAQWRKEHFATFLKAKRIEEKKKGLYARPFTDYLEMMEKKLFEVFWKEHKNKIVSFLITPKEGQEVPYSKEILALSSHAEIGSCLSAAKEAVHFASPDAVSDYLKTMRSFDELTRPLVGTYRTLRGPLEKHLAASFYPLAGYGSGRSQAFRQSTPLGSVFKVVVAYQALMEKYQALKKNDVSFLSLNPLTLIDDLKACPRDPNKQILGYTLEGTAIHRAYKGGKLPRSHPNIGKIDVMGALEQSSNLYFALLASEYIENPLNLIETCRRFGFGEKSGIELPGEFIGSLPSDLADNKTGLYAFAIGQHSLVVTPLQTAVMLSAIANHGNVVKPKIIQSIAGSEPTYGYTNPFDAVEFPFQKALESVGISFPLFTESEKKQTQEQLWIFSKEIKRSLPLPSEIRDILFQGMHQVIAGAKGTARPGIIRLLYQDPEMREHFYSLHNQLIGKTGTAEILYKQTLDAATPAKIHNHIWFSGISFEPSHPPFSKPELVLAVYLRFSEAGGKEAAPLASEMVHKWREIQSRRKALEE